MSVDPSIRVAACWLALELGSADLTAWPESCSYLGNKLPDRFDEFVDFAISRRDPRQIAQLSADPLLQLLATSAVAGPKAFSALADCASQLDSAQAARALQIVLSSSVNSRQNIFGAVGIKSLVGRLEPTQRARTAEAILEMLDQLLHREDWPLPWIFPTLWEFGPHLDHAQHVRVAEMLIARLDKLRGASSEYVTGHQPEITHILFQLGPLTKLTVPQAAHIRDTLTAIAAKLGGMGEGLIAVLPWLDEAQAQRIVQRFTDGSLAAGAFEEVATLAPRIQSVQAGRAWDLIIKRVKSPPHHPNNMAALPDPAPAVLQALASRLNSAKIKEEATASIATLETSADSHAVGRSLIALMALTPRLERAQVNRVGNALIGQLKKGTDDELVEARTWALETLIPRFEPAQAKGAWDVLVTMPSNWFSEDLAAIVPRMESRDVEAAANDIIAILRKPLPQSRNSSGLVSALSTLAPRLTPAQAQRAASALMALGQPGTGFGSTVPAFGALLTRIDAEYASKIGDALIATLETTTDTKARFEAMTELVELVPKLEPAQVPRAWKVLSANFSDATAWDALPAVVARLEPLSRDVESTRAATVLLDHACCDRVVWNSSVEFAPYISSPRALAKLLSHPGCVGEEREYLLRRFEELALYEGKAVFPKLQRREGSGARFIEVKADSGKQPSPAPPPRRFHNLHDAAAWIQQNWPDFDLETNCPVTWRGSR